METVKYKGYQIEIEPDQCASDPADDGNFTIHQKAEFHVDDYDDELTDEAKQLIKEGRLWPYQYYSHGPQCRYVLSESTIVNDGWILFSDGYAENFDDVAGRREMARQDLETYTQWANGKVYFVQVRDPYGDLVADDGEGMGDIVGYDWAIGFGKQVVDSDGINYATKAKNARELHR
jgi:hypothetical protein